MEEQPANHYRLLGLTVFEEARDVIQAAAERQTVFLRNFGLGKHQAVSQQLLNEVQRAKICLLTPANRAAYDARLRQELATKTAAGAATGEKAGAAHGAGLRALGAGFLTPPNQPRKVRRLRWLRGTSGTHTLGWLRTWAHRRRLVFNPPDPSGGLRRACKPFSAVFHRLFGSPPPAQPLP